MRGCGPQKSSFPRFILNERNFARDRVPANSTGFREFASNSEGVTDELAEEWKEEDRRRSIFTRGKSCSIRSRRRWSTEKKIWPLCDAKRNGREGMRAEFGTAYIRFFIFGGSCLLFWYAFGAKIYHIMILETVQRERGTGMTNQQSARNKFDSKLGTRWGYMRICVTMHFFIPEESITRTNFLRRIKCFSIWLMLIRTRSVFFLPNFANFMGKCNVFKACRIRDSFFSLSLFVLTAFFQLGIWARWMALPFTSWP